MSEKNEQKADEAKMVGRGTVITAAEKARMAKEKEAKDGGNA